MEPHTLQPVDYDRVQHAAYAKARTAREIAQAGIDSACEFDRNSAGPVDVFTLKLKV